MVDVKIQNRRLQTPVNVMGEMINPGMTLIAERETFLEWMNKSSGNLQTAQEYLEVSAVGEEVPIAEGDAPAYMVETTASGVHILSTAPPETPSGNGGADLPSPSASASPDSTDGPTVADSTGGVLSATEAEQETATDATDKPKTRRRRKTQE